MKKILVFVIPIIVFIVGVMSAGLFAHAISSLTNASNLTTSWLGFLFGMPAGIGSVITFLVLYDKWF